MAERNWKFAFIKMPVDKGVVALTIDEDAYLYGMFPVPALESPNQAVVMTGPGTQEIIAIFTQRGLTDDEQKVDEDGKLAIAAAAHYDVPLQFLSQDMYEAYKSKQAEDAPDNVVPFKVFEVGQGREDALREEAEDEDHPQGS